MESGSQAAVDGASGRSGGKVYKRRRIAAGKTPYDRPTTSLQSENPNWFNGLVLPAKFVANGASKLISSFWNPKSWASRSSSSSDSDSDSEGGIEDDENLSGGGAELNKGSSSGKSEILYLVEQLLMLEHYSREECDRLIEIINSRVEDYTIREDVDAGPNNPNIRNQTIMEARKLITKNMVGSSSKSVLDNGIHVSKTPNRDYLSGGSWNIENEIQRLRSKTVEIMEPNESKSLESPKLDDEIVNLASEDTRATRDDVPTEALSSLPTIEEQNQLAEEKDVEDESTEMPDVTASQDSSNTDGPVSTKEADIPIAKRRSRRYTNRGRGQPK